MTEGITTTTVRTVTWRRGEPAEAITSREWLVTNGLGGFSSATLALTLSRRYHGLLVAALPAPAGRVVMLSRLDEDLLVGERTLHLGAVVRDGVAHLSPAAHGVEFRQQQGLPAWRLDLGDHVVERRVLMPHQQNTVHVSYRLVAGRQPVTLRLRPLLRRRRLEDEVSVPVPVPSGVHADIDRCTVRAAGNAPALQLSLPGARFSSAGSAMESQQYPLEAARGYPSVGELWAPGSFEVLLEPGAQVTLLASTERWPACLAPAPDEAVTAELHRRSVLLGRAAPALRTGVGAELVLAADQFLITPRGRQEDAARAHAEGDEVGTVIAGYHWFTDWGRDTMISLEGLTLATGRPREAGAILRSFARHVRNGLIPNLFPEGHTGGLYNTADATLWFFHALHRYVQATGDRRTLRELLPQLHEIVAAHLRGTDFHIGVDPSDGLLRQGEEGYQLTWMDAKVGDWVVTPRRGKAVELQGLWYNALLLMARWSREEGDATSATRYADQAGITRVSFNSRFWCEDIGHLYDVVDGDDGDDASCRPNQILSFALEHPVLDETRWTSVLRVVSERLLTPVGLRSLAPGSAEYHATYDGDRRARDAAYHQGTVWPWLIGPYVDAWRRVHGEEADVGALLAGVLATLDEACVGQLSEIFDAERPYRPRGCVAQAWSVAEVLRCLAGLRRSTLDGADGQD